MNRVRALRKEFLDDLILLLEDDTLDISDDETFRDILKACLMVVSGMDICRTCGLDKSSVTRWTTSDSSPTFCTRTGVIYLMIPFLKGVQKRR